ncbi:MAG: PASTA domain-containing protein [Firmicutes bacterium]|nr:PASTA domain-containing protein [Bacillota bacterium]
MANRRKRPNPWSKINGTGMRRIVILAGIFGVLTFVILFCKLWQLQVTQHDWLENKAITQQTREVTSTAHRGTIYDANGDILAISAAVQNVILSPRDLLDTVKDEVKTKDEFGNPRSETAIEAEQKAKLQSTYDLIADNLSSILGIDRTEIMTRLQKTKSAYEVLAKKVEEDVSDQVRAFIEENKLERAIYLTDDSKRYYPYSTMASQVIGFVNSSNTGAYGLESLYNLDLAGTDGKIITNKNASGKAMPSSYSSYIDSINGYNVHTTIDSTIQMYAEKTLEEGIAKFDVINGGFCLVMDPDTGAVLGMASSPDYDLNDPSAIQDSVLQSTLNKIRNTSTEEEYEAALNAAQLKQWNNKTLNTTYEPGSTFKPIVVAAGLEEGTITDNSTFVCTGKVHIGDWDIRCSARSGHGTQNLRRAMMNSCNPALIKIGQSLGEDKFREYWENFGFTSTTGIELPGEQKNVFWTADKFGETELATASFGQRFTTTPIQLIRALSAVINGGHLMEPYVVQSVTDDDGNVVSYHEPKEIRQVISQETSDLVRSYMESVVNDVGGTGKNAKVAGYRIGGKTGSSQTLDSEDHIIVSFLGFAPADDPEVIVLLGYDWPQPAAPGQNTTKDGTYISGGNMAAPMAGELIANILDYLGYQKSGNTVNENGVTIPNVVGQTPDEARAALNALGLNVRTSGEGSVVTDQMPTAGSTVPKGSSTVLYLGEEKPKETVAMPDLSGMTYEEAKKALEDVGLYLNATGSGTSGTVFEQLVLPGTPVELGATVEVKFAENTEPDNGLSSANGDWAEDPEQKDQAQPQTGN